MDPRISSHPRDFAYLKANIPCQAACPAMTDVPAYIAAIRRGDYVEAYRINRLANILPGVLGRVCTRPCQKACRHGESDLGESVQICHLKRAAADLRSEDGKFKPDKLSPTGKKVAIVGSGPAGLAVAQTLALLGHAVTIYEAMPKPGGMLIYGIPDFRLPQEIVAEEIAAITDLGVVIRCNQRVGKDISLRQMRLDFDIVVVTTGCPLAKRVGISGEELGGVYPGLDFLVKLHLGEKLAVGRRVVVFGGGFTAVDCVRTAKRLGGQKVTLCIRRTVSDLPVPLEEIEEARQEGIDIIELSSPVKILGRSKVEGVVFQKNRFVVEKGAARKVPVPIPGTDFTLEADTAIGAIGQVADPSMLASGKDFEGETAGLFAAGDCVGGASSVIEAVGHAKAVAMEVDAYLMKRRRRQKRVVIEPVGGTDRKLAWNFIPRTPLPSAGGYTQTLTADESRRCYLCSLKYEIDISRCIYCRRCIEVCPRDCIRTASGLEERAGEVPKIIPARHWNETAGIVIENDRCVRCGECQRVCPTNCIEVFHVRLEERNEA